MDCKIDMAKNSLLILAYRVSEYIHISIASFYNLNSKTNKPFTVFSENIIIVTKARMRGLASWGDLSVEQYIWPQKVSSPRS